jgi:hypothetical protein
MGGMTKSLLRWFELQKEMLSSHGTRRSRAFPKGMDNPAICP